MDKKTVGVNSSCPCGSGKKYKNCCLPLHKGRVAKDALELMKSRYSAYAAGACKYIIKTTHPNNREQRKESTIWLKEICNFSQNSTFERLEIIDFINGTEEAFVTFTATIDGEKITEKSRFLKEGKLWLYESGIFL